MLPASLHSTPTPKVCSIFRHKALVLFCITWWSVIFISKLVAYSKNLRKSIQISCWSLFSSKLSKIQLTQQICVLVENKLWSLDFWVSFLNFDKNSKFAFLALPPNSWLCLPYICLTTANFRKTHSVSIPRHKCSLCLLLICIIIKCNTLLTNKPITWLRFSLICGDTFSQNLFGKYLDKS